jgi:hypothetical protein
MKFTIIYTLLTLQAEKARASKIEKERIKAEKAEAARVAKAAKSSNGTVAGAAAAKTKGATSTEDAMVAVAVAASTQASADAVEAEEAAATAIMEAELTAAAYLEAHKFATKETAEAHVAREAQEHAELKAAEAVARVDTAADGEDKANAEAEAEAAAATAAAAKATAEREQAEADAAVALQDQANERATAAEAIRQAKVDAKEAKSQIARDKADAVLRAQDKRARLVKKHLVEADEEVVNSGGSSGGRNETKRGSGMRGCFGGKQKATSNNGLSTEELRAAADNASPSFGLVFSLLLPAAKARTTLTDGSDEAQAVRTRVTSGLASSLHLDATQVALGEVWQCSYVVIVDAEVGGLGDRRDAELLLAALDEAVADGTLSSEASHASSRELTTIIEESEPHDEASTSPSVPDASGGGGAEEEKVQASDESSVAAAASVKEEGKEQEISTTTTGSTTGNPSAGNLLARCESEVPPYVIRSLMPLSAAAAEAKAKLAADAAAATAAMEAAAAEAAAAEAAAAEAAAAEAAAAEAAANAKALETVVTETAEQPPEPVEATNNAPETATTASGPDEPLGPEVDPASTEAARRAAAEALATAEAQLKDMVKQQQAADAALYATTNAIALKRKELDDLELRCLAAEKRALAAEAASAERAAAAAAAAAAARPMEPTVSPTSPSTPTRGSGISRAALDAAAADLSAALTPHKLAGALTVLPHANQQHLQAPSLRSAVALHRIHVADAVPAPPPFHGAPPLPPYGATHAAPSSPQQHHSGRQRNRSSWATHVDDAGDSNLGAVGDYSHGHLSPQPRSAGSFRRRGGAVPLVVPPPPPLFGNRSTSPRSPYLPTTGAMASPVGFAEHLKGINHASQSDERGPVENWRWVNDRDAYVR